MAYTDVTAEAVRKAVAEYDDRGAEDFLRAYGFEPARQYQLLVHGKRYPSKAIVGAAHQYVHGRPLRADEFSGGAATVVRHLASLGFEIEATRPVLMIHVGQAGLDNLEHGLETSTWGFRELPDDLADARFDFVVFGEGASPRVPDEDWFADTATLHICQATSGFYTTDAKHWPDELDRDELIYPVHFGILPLGTADAVPLGPDGPLPADASRQLKISGTHRGFGKIAHFDPAPLLARAGLADAVGLPRNPQERAKITLSRAPGTRRTQRTNPSGRHGSGPGRQQDPKKRIAVEQHAVKLAIAHYERHGWHVTELGKPYDLRCRRGDEELHVEVKGTTGSAAAVELTIKEIEHARGTDITDLFVVSEIVVDNDYTTTGGRTQLFPDWAPADEHLQPTKFRYELPPNPTHLQSHAT
ncbi:DUF3883 domain-containing protein [Amycolatopsis sp. FU40]|uniref:protein NO VEIN domain-containing protein n=1 Tax=Amycolatopsis sp. FU40 TaxID=2914159 RepID=UPI001F425300|nr:DUF3883 domain-containing protein [Amycolatopsis sp. FU40]UKD58583.1 DUF3883 domain-containing protein [Amycolatopsis sp. FU40]